jgi:hypothetical protein
MHCQLATTLQAVSTLGELKHQYFRAIHAFDVKLWDIGEGCTVAARERLAVYAQLPARDLNPRVTSGFELCGLACVEQARVDRRVAMDCDAPSRPFGDATTRKRPRLSACAAPA